MEAVNDAIGIVVTPRTVCERFMARETVSSATVAVVLSSILQSAIIADLTLRGVILGIVLNLVGIAIHAVLIVYLCKLGGATASFRRMFIVSAFLVSVLDPPYRVLYRWQPGVIIPTLPPATLAVGLLTTVLEVRALMWCIRVDAGLDRRASLSIALVSGTAIALAGAYLVR